MIKPTDERGYHPMTNAGWHATIDCGYYGLDLNIARALGKKGHLGYFPESSTWASQATDCGYYAMNRSITIALQRLARS